MKIKATLLITLLLFTKCAFALDNSSMRTEPMSSYADVQDFANEIAKKHKMNAATILKTFDNLYFNYRIIEYMDKPAEKRTWTYYSKNLISKERIKGGRSYMRKWKTTLNRAYRAYGVPPAIITAIIGIETVYGKASLKYDAVTALSTLAFEYPRRSKYFKSELEGLFVLASKEKVSPLSYASSYAGAVGIAQFMPSNLIRYGKDGDRDKHVNIVSSHPDAIMSVANYMKEHGWQRNGDILDLVKLKKEIAEPLFTNNPCDISNKKSVKQWRELGVTFSKRYADNVSGVISKLEEDDGSFTPVIFFANACAINRYNHSTKYTTATALLAKMLAR
ncbi:MAG: lytic murein transglycosylase [Deferribacteraceae bacterium]|jgi:membrane-bound lytic murein transglycosylase B|nr:lytic murein transglycosylase [Deferribacteraceae bacterium]